MVTVHILLLGCAWAMLTSAVPLPDPADPLGCFLREPASSPNFNVCFQAYPLKYPGSNLTTCALSCLNDTDCTQFVYDTIHPNDCRISHTCVEPTSKLNGFDGYLRKPGCGGKPAPPAPTPPPAPVGLKFGGELNPTLWSSGMILQRGAARVWGTGAAGAVTVQVHHAGGLLTSVVAKVGEGTNWTATVSVPATIAAVLTATDASGKSVSLQDVAFGDVVLCGGQSNMGFGMCGATSKTQTPAQAFDMVAKSNLRVFFQEGSGPYGGAGGRGCPTSQPGEVSITPAHAWFTANRTNVGGASAICMLTAHQLALKQPDVPVGAVESCVSATPVTDWTPPSGRLWVAFMEPLLPMSFKLAIWDQGERDAKITSSAYYTTEFPKMVSLWRSNFLTPALPFFYVELCTEYGAEEPKESDFWQAQRAVLQLPATGFVTTTDIQRALHPPDKQDVAVRLMLEVDRIVYGQNVVSRGPQLVAAKAITTGSIKLTFSNASLVTRSGVFVGDPTACMASPTNNTAFMQFAAPHSATQMVAINFSIAGSEVTIQCDPAGGPVKVNSDASSCFLYSAASSLPATPIEVNCTHPELSVLSI